MPLVGIESQLNEPLIINSPDFEPDDERQSLLLTGPAWNEEKDVITETGINQKIYEHIFPLYDKIVNYLTNKHYGKMYFLANGLDRSKSHEHFMLTTKGNHLFNTTLTLQRIFFRLKSSPILLF